MNQEAVKSRTWNFSLCGIFDSGKSRRENVNKLKNQSFAPCILL